MRVKIGIFTWVWITVYNISSVYGEPVSKEGRYQSLETEQFAPIHRRSNDIQNARTAPTKEASLFRRTVSAALPVMALAAIGATAYTYWPKELPHEAKFRKNEKTKFHLGNNFLAVPLPLTRERIKNQVLIEFFDTEAAPKPDGSRRIISVQYAGDYNSTDEKTSPEAIIFKIHTHVKMETRQISHSDNPEWDDLSQIARTNKTLDLKSAVDKVNSVTRYGDNGPFIRELERLTTNGVLRVMERWSKPHPIRKELTKQLEEKKKGAFIIGELAKAHLEEYDDKQGPRPIPGFGYTEGSYMPLAEGFHSIRKQLGNFLDAAVVDRLVSLFGCEIDNDKYISKYEGQDWMEFGVVPANQAVQTTWKILDQTKQRLPTGGITYPFDGQELAREIVNDGIEIVAINYHLFNGMTKSTNDSPMNELKLFVSELQRNHVEVQIVKGLLEGQVPDIPDTEKKLREYLQTSNFKLTTPKYGTKAEKDEINGTSMPWSTASTIKRRRLESTHAFKLFELIPGATRKKRLWLTDSLAEARHALGFGIPALHLPCDSSEFDRKSLNDMESVLANAMKLREDLTSGFLALDSEENENIDNNEQEGETGEAASYQSSLRYTREPGEPSAQGFQSYSTFGAVGGAGPTFHTSVPSWKFSTRQEPGMSSAPRMVDEPGMSSAPRMVDEPGMFYTGPRMSSAPRMVDEPGMSSAPRMVDEPGMFYTGPRMSSAPRMVDEPGMFYTGPTPLRSRVDQE